MAIFESRPPWREDVEPEWTKTKIAQMRWDPEAKLWSMWWADRILVANKLRDVRTGAELPDHASVDIADTILEPATAEC